ncbi:MAG TPA: SDR family NAD(P)-dependent oxidoreductase [Chitinophagaceae bacterium]|jgi:NAD(P)-dependent dehydrogenase (short-subunit alcohol dehydrogenase family)
MARIFITGSTDGLGQLAAKELVSMGHHVVLHARNADRRKYALQKVSGAADVLIADLSSIDETKTLAAKANASGKFDAIIHNAGVYHTRKKDVNADDLPVVFTVNSLAPYILTCLIQKPKRLIYLSSGMHLHGNACLDNLPVGRNEKNNHITYSDTKLHDVILAMAVARKWTDVYSNAVNPGWVPTAMGGAGAPDDLQKGFETQVWLAVNNNPAACVSGRYFFHKRETHYIPAAKNVPIQEKFIAICQRITGIKFPQ